MSEPKIVEKKSYNKNLKKASKAKNDEFYTQISDIEKELRNYKEYLRGKVVFCNCDDPLESHFWRYFSENFEFLGLKKLVSTHYEDDKPSYKLEIVADINDDGRINKLDTTRTPLRQNGDFRSPECIEILKSCDIVVTNPPFSLFREYIGQLMEYDKKFVIVGNQNAITYKETFELIRENKIWLGIDNGGTKWFEVPAHYDIATESRKKIENGKKFFSMGSIMWFTNLDHKKRHESLILYKEYNSNDYPAFDNYDAINVDKVSDIPKDHAGAMGVPITFLDKYNPEQFQVLGILHNMDGNDGKKARREINNGQKVYCRIVIKNKKL